VPERLGSTRPATGDVVTVAANGGTLSH